MFTEKDFFGESSISSLVKDVSTIEFKEDDTEEKIGVKFGEIDMLCSCCPKAPNFVTRYTPYYVGEGDNKEIKFVTVSIRLRKQAMVNGDSFGDRRKFAWNSNIYKDVVSFICGWIDNYNITVKAMANANELSATVAPFCDTIKVSFAYSDNPIVAMDNTSVTVGLSDMALASLAGMPLFSDNELRKDMAEDNCSKLFKSFISPVDIYRNKSMFVKELGVTTKASVAKMLKKAYRKSITDKDAVNVVCRFEKDGYTGLIKRVPIADVVEDDNIAYVDDDYAYIFVLNPIGKNDEMLTDIDKLETMVKEVVS